MYTTLAAADIVAFGGRARDLPAQLFLRETMYDIVKDAFTITQLPWDHCHREDRGDGMILLAPPDSNPDAFLDPLAHHLAALLRRRNRHAAEHVRLRLRFAVHHGYVRRDEHGFAGAAAIHVCRLLEATEFKNAIHQAACDFSLIVSDTLYTDAVQRGDLIDPDAYRPTRVTVKETRTGAWIWLPPNSSPTEHRP